jgi:hypothetical protein
MGASRVGTRACMRVRVAEPSAWSALATTVPLMSGLHWPQAIKSACAISRSKQMCGPKLGVSRKFRINASMMTLRRGRHGWIQQFQWGLYRDESRGRAAANHGASRRIAEHLLYCGAVQKAVRLRGLWILPESVGGEACSCKNSREGGFQTRIASI